MNSAFTESQFAEGRAIDRIALETHGWVSVDMSAYSEPDLAERLLGLAEQMGTPTPTRPGGPLVEMLRPTISDAAKEGSLSKIHSAGEFPLHIDTAHWLTPCRYLILGCLSPGAGNRSTALLDTKKLPLTDRHISLLQSVPLRVTNGRKSFFSTILSKARPFIRFDSGCMTATTPDDASALDVFSRQNWPDHIKYVHWDAGIVLVIDNWRVLHGRGLAECPDFDRTLLRLSIQ